MQADYKHLCNSLVGHYVMYVKANVDVIAVTMATDQLRPSPKGTSKFKFLQIIPKTKSESSVNSLTPLVI